MRQRQPGAQQQRHILQSGRCQFLTRMPRQGVVTETGSGTSAIG
jgi:hypothetical protein